MSNNFLFSSMEEFIFIFIYGVLFSFATLFIIKHFFYKWKILDNPKKYWKTRDPVPYSMGVVFFVSFFVLSFFTLELSTKLSLLWIFWSLITLVSFFDDRMNLSPKIRLIIQIIIGWVIGVSAIKIWYISNIFWWVIDLDQFFIQIFDYKIYLISLFFTIIWYVFIFNSLNWTDGIPGNTSGICIISFFVLFLLWYKLYLTDTYEWWKENAIFIMSLALILLSVLIPFWYYDVKEKILMWDSGTMFLWFMLASLAIIAWWKVATVLSVFWIYAVDALYVVFQRMKNKKNPLNGDSTHLHHRLLQAWLQRKNVLLFIYFFSFLFWIISLFLDTIGKIILFFCIILFVLFAEKLVYFFKK